MGLFDWLGRRRHAEPDSPVAALTWRVYRDAGDVVADDGRGAPMRVAVSGMRCVRVVPLTGGNHHRGAGGGWQVTFSRPEGDVLVGKPLADWRSARQLAQLLSDRADLPLDELTEKMFSRVGQDTPTGEA